MTDQEQASKEQQSGQPSAPAVEVGPPFLPSPSPLAFSCPPPAPEPVQQPRSRRTMRWLPEESSQNTGVGPESYLVQTGRAVAEAALALFAPLGKRFAPVPPIHFNEKQLRRVERFAREAGWVGPVLWYIPENLTLLDLCKLEVISSAWWTQEANFPQTIPTVSPYDDAGYWVLGFPIPHPSTVRSTLEEQQHLLPAIAHVLGFRKADIVLGDATDLAVVSATARFMGLLDLERPLAVRTETCLHLSEAARSWFEHLDRVNVSLIHSNNCTELGDYPNTARTPFLGISPLLY